MQNSCVAATAPVKVESQKSSRNVERMMKMTRNSDLEMLLAELDAENLRKLGEPPGIEQLEAYMRDELPEGEEKERVRAMIVVYPELARAVALWRFGASNHGSRSSGCPPGASFALRSTVPSRVQ